MDLAELTIICQDLKEKLTNVEVIDERRKLINQHIDNVTKTKTFVLPEFDVGLEWINVQKPLTLNDLEGKIVVLDFFTYCCINCMHVLPDLKLLEGLFSVEDGIVIIGVHSAKFENEKILANIISAVLRYNILHPVVNDSEAKLWSYLQVMCWPTILILSPSHKPLFVFMGEGHQKDLIEYTSIAFDYFKKCNELRNHKLPVISAHDHLSKKELLFPGKICISSDGENIIIADTGHHRIVIVTKEGLLMKTIGDGVNGFKDGAFSEARFFSPQGVACKAHIIFVADTENHAIRQIDLKQQMVTTLAGTGQQGFDFVGGRQGPEQCISSPWDLCLGSFAGSLEQDLLFIAMAGTHQIWIIFLKDGPWLKNSFHKAGECLGFAGSGQEENRNNSYPQKAGFAQPSGITLASINSNEYLYIADSESSSIRSISLENGEVKAVTGASKDPTNLFAFGDLDGIGSDAKLQHPLGITWNKTKNILYIADSYNHKIKTVEPVKKMCQTLVGSNKFGNTVGNFNAVQFNEPGGLCLSPDERFLYIADTNNHAIKVVDLEQKIVKELPLIAISSMPVVQNVSKPQVKVKRITPHVKVNLEPVVLAPAGVLCLQFNLQISPNFHLNSEAPHSWKLFLTDCSEDFLGITGMTGQLKNLEEQPNLKLKALQTSLGQRGNLEIEIKLYLCDIEGKCYVKHLLFMTDIKIEDGGLHNIELPLQVNLSC